MYYLMHTHGTPCRGGDGRSGATRLFSADGLLT